MLMNMSSESVQSRDNQRQATQRAVMASAEKLFRENGFKATTVRQIVLDAGVSIGTGIVAGDKEALLVAIFDGWIAQVHGSRPVLIEAAVSIEDEVAAAVAALIVPFLELFAANLDLAREHGAILLRGSHRSAIFQELATTLKHEFGNVLERHSVAQAKAAEAATAIYFSYLGMLLSWAGGAYDQHTALDQLTAVIGAVTKDLGQ